MAKDDSASFPTLTFDSSKLVKGDCIEVMKQYPDNYFQAIIADPPYFQALTTVDWDNTWANSDAWLAWSLEWIKECRRVLKDDGILFIFGQLGKREHIWLHLCSEASKIMQFHDMVIWDRVVGYNDRGDSFTPQYEMALMLRKEESSQVYFDKDSVRIEYNEATIQKYMKDKRYKDMVAREEHLRRGKKATNILSVPSLKGASKEKVGHPSQKPEALIDILIQSTTRPGDVILDPFLGSGTTAVVAQALGRVWIGIDLEEEYIDMSHKRLTERFPEVKDSSVLKIKKSKNKK